MNKRINSLRKEKVEGNVKRKHKPISKLKLSLGEDLDKTINKIVRFYGSQVENSDEYTMEDIESVFKFNFFNVEVFSPDEDMQRVIVNSFLKGEPHNGLKFKITSIYDNEPVEVYSALGIKLTGDKYTKCKYKRRLFSKTQDGVNKRYEEYRILDFNYILGYLKMLDESFNYYLTRINYLTINKKEHTFEKAIDIINFDNFFSLITKWGGSKEQRERWSRYYDMAEMIRDAVVVLAYEDNRFHLMDEYNSNSKTDYAKTYQTKKNIPEKILNIMNNNVFLKDFKYVEADELTDITKFREIEREYLKLRQTLNLSELIKGEPTLRFRRLGKLKAYGVYYPGVNCMAIDIKSPSSFMHELGHLIDYTLNGEELPLSLKEDFTEIGVKYSQAFIRDVGALDSKDSIKAYLQRKVGYFTTPTEMFARSLEIYLMERGFISSFTKEGKESLTLDRGFPNLSDDTIENIIEYFDGIIKIKSDYYDDDDKNSSEDKEVADDNIYLNLIDMADRSKDVNFVVKSFKKEEKDKKRQEKSLFYEKQVGIQMKLF